MKKVIALDLDGTLAYFDKWEGLQTFGDPIPGAAEFTQELSKDFDIVINTCRCSADIFKLPPSMLKRDVQQWLDKHGFVYHDIYYGSGKVSASFYVDDRAIECRPQDRTIGEEHLEYQEVLDKIRRMAGVK